MTADPSFWRGRRVLLTGHTGFKGSWTALWLTEMGAEVTGFALPPESEPSPFGLITSGAASVLGDLRDADLVDRTIADVAPEIVLHMAAQALVRRSYRDPRETFGSNVMGTVNLLDALTRCPNVRTILVVTSDKVYENDESGQAFTEADRLGGHDPYAASKAATEIVASSFARSFFDGGPVRLATARGGNVIGGGDFSEDRLIPDIVRAARSGRTLVLRNPQATRPWQHVLDCIDGYLCYAQALGARSEVPTALNFGPHDPADVLTVAQVSTAMVRAMGADEDWRRDPTEQPHEMSALALDPTAARKHLGWQGRLRSDEAIQLTADWYAAWANGADTTRVTLDQISAYRALEETIA